MNTRFDPELSRLAFEDRLIEYCEDESLPLLERVRLLGIIAERLDVFFMTRVGRLKRLAQSDYGDEAAMVAAVEQQQVVAVEAHRVVARVYRLLDELLPQLAAHGIRIESWESLDESERRHLTATCCNRLPELVRPVVIEATQMFPHVRNLRPALIARARPGGNGLAATLVVELPAEVPRLVPLATGHRFVPLEQVIKAELPKLCPDFDAEHAHLFRVTRNGHADFSAEDDVLESIEEQVVWRPFQDVVRLEVEANMPLAMRDWLLDELQREAGTPGPSLADRDSYVIRGLMDMTALSAIADVDLPQLKSAAVKRRSTRVDHMLDGPGRDLLLHFPFDDYETSLERLLSKAADHPELESMRTTIYRTDENSDVVGALRAARARGADVTAVVEVKASFDEHDNIEWARVLGAEGVRVVLSPATLKVHAKIGLVMFKPGHSPRRVALIGTGNMNAVTARSYVDLWLVTSDDAITAEVALLFDLLQGKKRDPEFKELLVSPFNMRHRLLELIENETANATAGLPAGIRGMTNGLTDSAVIAALHRASQAGVPIELVVRGACLLRPGAPEISENVRIVSVAGQLLQHARIYTFRNGGADQWFIGSADWRPRNLDRRVEVVAPVRHREQIAMLDRMLTDTFNLPDAWVLGPDGVYVRRTQPSRAPALPLRAAARR